MSDDKPVLDEAAVAREVVFRQVCARLQGRAPLMYNLWVMLGRGEPRSVAKLAEVLWYPDAPPPTATLQGQRVGAFISHINARIKDHKVIIRPGALRGTYQLYPLDEWQREQARLRAELLAIKTGKKIGKVKLVPRNPRAPETKPRMRRPAKYS